MSVITISRGSFSGGKEFAENLAEKLGYRCLSREELSEEAIKLNVPVGKLQTAMVKPPRVYQRMIPQRDFYLSCITSILCKYILEGALVYHGHTGHLLLTGIPNIFRVRVVGNMEYRIGKAMSRMRLSRDKAIEYIHNVDGDRDKWVRFLYGVNWNDPSHYDIVINLDQVGVANATTALCSMAELPDFKLTPAMEKALKDLYLSSRARLLLARDPKTSYADFKVTAYDGTVQVTCMPQYAETAEFVHEVLRDLDGCSDIKCTIASSSILWLGESFNAKSDLFKHVVKVAQKWDAAVELMRISDAGPAGREKEEEVAVHEMKKNGPAPSNYTGGIEDDVETETEAVRDDVDAVLDELAEKCCSGGSSTVYGDRETLLSRISQQSRYRMVVIGDLFISKGESIRTRLTSEMRRFLSDNIKAPVVSADELKQELKFKPKDYLRLAAFIALACILFLAVFLNQETVVQILASESYKQWRVLVVIVLLLIVPIFAFAYGSFVRQVFKFFRLE